MIFTQIYNCYYADKPKFACQINHLNFNIYTIFIRMKKYMLKFFLVLPVILPLWLAGQNYEQNPSIHEKIREIVEEKLKVDPNQPLSPAKLNPAESEEIHRKEFLRASNETQVTTNSIPESEVHAAINPVDSNNIVLSPIRYVNLVGSYTMTCPVIYTKDYGQSWHESSFQSVPVDISNPTVVGGGDPVLAFDANGKLYMTWINLYIRGTSWDTVYWALLWAYSEDGGETWQRAVNDKIGFSSGKYIPFTIKEIYDKQWMAADHSNSTYRNSLYVAYYKANTITNSFGIYIREKRASSQIFEPGETLVSNNSFQDVQFSNIAVDSHGFVHVVFYGSKDKTQYSLWHSVSQDGGNSFSIPVKITNLVKATSINGIKNNRIYPAPQLAIDHSDSSSKNNLYLTFTAIGIDSAENTGSDIYFTRSVDHGQNWTTPIIVNDNIEAPKTNQFYSSIYVNPVGNIIISWYDGRASTENTKNDTIRYYMAFSFDEGQSFTKNFNVSAVASDFQTIGKKNNSFGIGEYNQVLATKSTAIAVWADGRKGTGDLDIYVAFAPITTHPVGIKEISAITVKASVSSTFPQPAMDYTSVIISLLENSSINASLLNLSGQTVQTIDYGKHNPGKYTLNFETGKLANGQYLLFIQTDFGYFTRKVNVVH